MNQFNKIFTILSIVLLTSCTKSNIIKNYDYSAEDNRTIVKDFSLNDARNCVRTIRNYYFSSFNESFGIDIYYYLGKDSNENGNIILPGLFEPFDKMHESYYSLSNEKVGNYEFNWYSILGDNLITASNPILIYSNQIYSLSDAYQKGYLEDENLANIQDILLNHLNEYKVFMRFSSTCSL